MKIAVDGKLLRSGFGVDLSLGRQKRHFGITYPNKIWSNYPQKSRRSLLDNFAFVSTCHLPFQNSQISDIYYNGRRPLAEASYLRNLFYSIPFDSFMNGHRSYDLYRQLINTQFHFRKERKLITLPAGKIKLNPKKAVLPFTFGKDSLLTYALCRELGIATRLLFIVEPKELYAGKHKEEVLKQFKAEFHQTVDFIDNPIGELRDESAGNGWLGWELLLTSFTLIGLPFAYSDFAKYIFYANEASCNELTASPEGFILNPVFEQSEVWTREQTLIAQTVSGQDIKVASLIGQIHEIAIIKILHRVYPEIGKYQISCFADRPEARNKRWCAACSKCARNYIFLLANGIDPKAVGFEDNMLGAEFRRYYSIFLNGKGGQEGYDATELGRDEQLLAFLLAFQKGARGPLIDLFKKDHLKKVVKKEKSLRSKYFSLHPSGVLPDEYSQTITGHLEKWLKD